MEQQTQKDDDKEDKKEEGEEENAKRAKGNFDRLNQGYIMQTKRGLPTIIVIIHQIKLQAIKIK